MGLSEFGEVGITTELGRAADSKPNNDIIHNPSDLDHFMVCRWYVSSYFAMSHYFYLTHMYILILTSIVLTISCSFIQKFFCSTSMWIIFVFQCFVAFAFKEHIYSLSSRKSLLKTFRYTVESSRCIVLLRSLGMGYTRVYLGNRFMWAKMVKWAKVCWWVLSLPADSTASDIF